MSETRFWELYRQERSKIAPGKKGWRVVLSPQQITAAARAARKKLDAERET